MTSSLNPHHPTTISLNGQWHKIAAILVSKAGGHVVISPDDVNKALATHKGFIAVQELRDGLHLRLVDEVTAKRLARENGGLPN